MSKIANSIKTTVDLDFRIINIALFCIFELVFKK
jgi:hypothetical protein